MQTVFVAEVVPSQNKGEAALMWGIVNKRKGRRRCKVLSMFRYL